MFVFSWLFVILIVIGWFFFQTQRLIKDRMGDSVCVEKYDIGKCLSLSYWRYGSSFFSVLNCHLFDILLTSCQSNVLRTSGSINYMNII